MQVLFLHGPSVRTLRAEARLNVMGEGRFRDCGAESDRTGTVDPFTVGQLRHRLSRGWSAQQDRKELVRPGARRRVCDE
jgi:hypothetical protein